MRGITPKDLEMYEHIKSYMKEHGTTPTIREIRDGMGFKSTSSVHNHIQRLIMHGYINPISDGQMVRYSVKGMKYVEVQ